MALLQPGIQENLTFSSESVINKEGTLNLVMEMVLSDALMMAAMENDESIEPVKSGILVFTPKITDFDGNAKTHTQVLGEVNDIKKRLLEYAGLLGPRVDASAAFGGHKMLSGFGVAPTEYMSLYKKFTDQATVNKAMTKMVSLFLDYMKSQSNFSEVTFRHKFYRQSKNKQFATIPYGIRGEIVESMEIPKGSSKLNFNEWEVEHGKNDPTPPSSDKVKKDPAKQVDLFGGGDEEEVPSHLQDDDLPI
tara:strand:+ start:337 stop:1083 length:747 start_codon:yes stop_codon:yes gene_type:complete